MPHVLIAKVSTVDQPNHEIGEISFNLVSKQITFHKLIAHFIPMNMIETACKKIIPKRVLNTYFKSQYYVSPPNFVLLKENL
jgi:hypothetical protein